jgi:hypothetical protein
MNVPRITQGHLGRAPLHYGRSRLHCEVKRMTDTKNQRHKRNGWTHVDRIVRSVHLYTGLFLVPWMLVYAASAFFLNHGPTFRKWLDFKPPKLEVVREVDFVPNDSFPKVPVEQAAAILKHLELEGAHRVMPAQSNARQLKVLRICGRGNYVITWHRPKKTIVVQQQQPFSYIRLVNFLHFKAGYGQSYPAHVVWAAVVDIVTLSIAFWVVSGVYIWARRPKKRLLGGVCVVGGSVLFIALVLALCY